jgi:hypothetical protein
LREDFVTTSPLPPGLAPANDPASPPFGAFAPNAAQAAIIALAQRTELKRGAFRPMLSRLLNLCRGGPVDFHYQGASFRFYHQASATERGALFNPDYNREELDFLRAHMPSGGVFVDVGANVGTYAMALARHVGPAGTVIAIEPHPITHARPGRWRIDDRDRRRQSRRQPRRVGRRRGPRHPGALAAAAAHSPGGFDRPRRCLEDRRRGF